MRWLKDLWNKQLKPAWRYETKGVLWRLLPSDNGLFVGEDRDPESKSVSFFCIEQETGNVLWKDVQFKEKWWISIEAIHKNTLFLHEYASPDMPDHKKIYAVRLEAGELMWMNDEVTYVFAYDKSVYTSKDLYDDRAFFELDLSSGRVIRELDASYLNVLRETVDKNREMIEFPQLYDLSQVPNLTVKKQVERVIAKVKSIARTDYIDKNNALVIGYYEDVSKIPAQQDLRQHIVMVDQSNNRILYEDIIQSHSSTIVPDTFFCIDNFIFYIKDKKQLTAIHLSRSLHSNGKDKNKTS